MKILIIYLSFIFSTNSVLANTQISSIIELIENPQVTSQLLKRLMKFAPTRKINLAGPIHSTIELYQFDRRSGVLALKYQIEYSKNDLVSRKLYEFTLGFFRNFINSKGLKIELRSELSVTADATKELPIITFEPSNKPFLIFIAKPEADDVQIHQLLNAIENLEQTLKDLHFEHSNTSAFSKRLFELLEHRN